MDAIMLFIFSMFLLAIILIIIVLNIIQSISNKRVKQNLEKLEIQKNDIEGTPIQSELAKIDSFLKNEKLESKYNNWKDRLDLIKNDQLPKISDLLLETEHSINQNGHKMATHKVVKLEMEIYRVRESATKLLEEIKEITTCEEKNRSIITSLKSRYRELYKTFKDTESDFGSIKKPVSIQFENIAYKFDDFEKAMENNEYSEVTTIIKSIDELLKHMEVVVEEVPSIDMLANDLIPKKINEVEKVYYSMVDDGYPLDYLNIEYNIEEAKKKMSDILTRANILNLEDSLFELKLLLEYFDGVFDDFEREKINRTTYEEANKTFKEKLDKINNLLKEIYSQIGDIKNVYNFSDEDMELLEEVNKDVDQLNKDYKLLLDHTSNNTFAYSKLTNEIDDLKVRLVEIENRLDNSLDAIGSMREDEVRARQQLEEVKQILKESKNKIREYNFPVIPKSYFVELNEAQDAIKEVVKELKKMPITISVLNTRVDTARDLSLKLFAKTKELMKTAKFCEMAIVYGNRYRTNTEDLDRNLTISESLFYKGDYNKSLEVTINALNRIEPGIYEKLLSFYDED